jgi:hypothetical protein
MKIVAKAAPQAAGFKLDFLPQTRHPISTKYSALVFWLLGLSTSSIAKLLLIPRTSISSIIARSEYADRSSMTDRQRQAFVDELRAIRFEDGRPLDAGRLDGIAWTIQPLAPSKIRPRKASAS